MVNCSPVFTKELAINRLKSIYIQFNPAEPFASIRCAWIRRRWAILWQKNDPGVMQPLVKRCKNAGNHSFCNAKNWGVSLQSVLFQHIFNAFARESSTIIRSHVGLFFNFRNLKIQWFPVRYFPGNFPPKTERNFHQFSEFNPAIGLIIVFRTWKLPELYWHPLVNITSHNSWSSLFS